MVKKFLKDHIGTIIFLVIVGVFVWLGFNKVDEARGNAIKYAKDYEAPEATANLQGDGEYVSIAKTDSLELLYNDVSGTIQVIDLATGHLWKSAVDEEVYAKLKKSNKQWVANMKSAIHIKYNDLKKRDSGVKELYAAKDCGELTSEYIENGVAVTYGFLTPGIYVTVEYTIEGDELVVRIPWEKIEERARFAITTITVLPYLGTCGNENDGYLFYPDGCGAISTFARVPFRPSNVKLATYYTYSNKSVSLGTLYSDDNYDRYTAAMPVCGIKNGDYAVMGYATKGAENTAVVVYPSGYVIDLNHLGFDVFTRNVYNVDMYSVSTSTDAVSTGGQVQRVDKTLIPEDKEIRYRFLSGDQANYSGMAAAYREYLLDNGLLKTSDKVDNNALALRLLMGTKKDGIIFDEYVAMTDYNQVIDVLERLRADGIDRTQVILEAWQNDYEEYEYWGPDRHLGGKKGLKKVSEYAASTDGVDVYIENGFSVASSDTSGVNEEEDVVYNGLDIEVAQKFMTGDLTGMTIYMMNAYAMRERNAKFLKKLSSFEGINTAYEYEGKYAYTDFNEWHPMLKAETVNEIRGLLDDTVNSGKKVASKGANQYVYSYTDYLYSLKQKSYGLSITDYAVPFIQMVVSGNISYSSGDAGNLAYDLPTQKLEWIEFGSMPYFYLTAESALKLRDTGRDLLFSSTFEDWEPVVVDTWKEMNTRLASVSGRRMVGHEILSENVRKVSYDNGTVIYINYADAQAEADGIVIPAKDYVVIGGER